MRRRAWGRAACVAIVAALIGCSWALEGGSLGSGDAARDGGSTPIEAGAETSLADVAADVADGADGADATDAADVAEAGAPPLCTSASGPPSGTGLLASLSFSDFSFVREPGATVPSALGWSKAGLDLDGRCTLATSTDVCAPPVGTSGASQADGVGGIDNSFGRNVCPTLEALAKGSCSGGSVQIVVTSAGRGTMRVPFGSTGASFVLEVADVHVQPGASGGVVAGVISYASLLKATREASFALLAACATAAFSFVTASMSQGQDILTDGSNRAGVACDGVSFGFTFASSSPFTGTIVAPNKCP